MLRVGIVVQVLIVIVGCALRMPWLGEETTFYECYDLSASSQEQNCPSLNEWNKFPCSSCTNCQFECKAPFNFQSQYAKIHNYSVCVHPSKDEQRRWSRCNSAPAVRACVCTDRNLKQQCAGCKKHCLDTGYVSANCGLDSCQCEYTAELSEDLRTFVAEKQNSFRSKLALGRAINKDGRNLTKASNIFKLEYNTDLEWYGRRWASKCQPKYRFKDVHNVLGNIYYHQAEKALRNLAGGSWALLKARGIDHSKLSVNVGSDMASWAQMMWHKAREVGCGVYYCKGINQTLANCVYDRPYDWGAKVYQPGTPCSGKGCTSCDKNTGLCQPV